MLGAADHWLRDLAAVGASAELAPHNVSQAWPLPAVPAPQTFDHFMQEHLVTEAIEPGKLANGIPLCPATPAPDAQNAPTLIPDRIDGLGAGIVGHVRMMFSCE